LRAGQPGRAFALGRAIGEELSYLDQRILFIGSGGLSHSPPSLVSTAAGLSDAERLAMNAAGLEAAKDKIDPAWEQAFLRRIAEEPASLERLTSADIENAGVGAHEVRTWIAAVAAGNTPMEVIVYEPVREWITGMGAVASR
jgi:2,3-dihydroxyphenylpropionate 1,2-dioxygenase